MTTIQVGDQIADKDGNTWLIVCVDAPGTQPVVGVRDNLVEKFNANGTYFNGGDEDAKENLDLSTIMRPKPARSPAVALNDFRRLSVDSELTLALVPDAKGIGADALVDIHFAFSVASHIDEDGTYVIDDDCYLTQFGMGQIVLNFKGELEIVDPTIGQFYTACHLYGVEPRCPV
jgi:hypothetical protein